MPVYSHSKKTNLNGRVGSKLLIDHLSGVRNKALSHISERTEFGNEIHCQLLNAICWLHDLGKFTSYFQTYLIDSAKVDRSLKSHSNIGAQTVFKFFEEDLRNALLAYYIIKMHHSNLMNIDLVVYPENKQYILLEELNLQKQKSALNDLSELMIHFNFSQDLIQTTTAKSMYDKYKMHLRKKTSIEDYFRVNYLFSLLIEADKLDASDTIPVEFVSISENAVEERRGFGKAKAFEKPLSTELSQNEIRNYVRAQVTRNIDREDILKKRIFTLAAPTGIGKTMTSLDFVLKLRHKIKENDGYYAQIIYGLPFINIIEQAVQEYEITLGSEVVMAHYQYADVFGQNEHQKGELDDNENAYEKQRMSWDTWQKDIVITSFVQLFETLIGNKNRLLKKFRHFADAIIILDEVQTLAIDKLPVIGAALHYLCKYLNTRVLIMTATQPKLFELMTRELNIKINDAHLVPLNLLEDDEKVFACFNRTKIVSFIKAKIENENFVDLFDKYWRPEKSCLIVLNKVNRSIDIFNLLKDKFAGNQRVKMFYLSTNITPVERQKRIGEIRIKLKTNTCILISTQVVEAGVDLDFDMGFRDLGPIDSIVQVAGRINRENSSDRKGSPLYIIDFGDCQKIYGNATDINARKALSQNEIEEKDYKPMVEAYFSNVSDRKMSDFDISKDTFDAMCNLQYAFPASSAKKHRTVSDFKIIEESQNGISVFVEQHEDKEGTDAREAFQKLLCGEIKRSEFDQKFKRAFNQRIIAIPNYLNKVAELQREGELAPGILWIKPLNLGDYYDLSTGFIRKDRNSSFATVSF